MDKYVNIEKIEGLELLSDPRKMKKKQLKEYLKNSCKGGTLEVKFINNSYLDSFKEFLKNKINNFNPNKNEDKFDTLILSLWHQYIFHNVDENKYYEFVNILNSNIKPEPSDNNSDTNEEQEEDLSNDDENI